MTATVAELAAAQDELYRRVAAYHALPGIGHLQGWTLWALCARNAAWCRLLAASWWRVHELTPAGLLGTAAVNSVFYFDAERERWRSLSRMAADDRCGYPSPDPCRLVAGHPGPHGPSPADRR